MNKVMKWASFSIMAMFAIYSAALGVACLHIAADKNQFVTFLCSLLYIGFSIGFVVVCDEIYKSDKVENNAATASSGKI